jgi:hypothetical protein
MAKKDLIGFESEFFKVVSFLEMRRNNQGKMRAFWSCVCSCGKDTVKNTLQLTSGIPRSCGCYVQIRKGNSTRHEYLTKHGMANKHPLYKVWKNMKTRCYNPNNKGYKWWGAKDISICQEWRDDAGLFINWCLSNGWKTGLSIDRIDPLGNYESNNCQFITRSENTKKMNDDKRAKNKVEPQQNVQ